jgi:hypothetical protein
MPRRSSTICKSILCVAVALALACVSGIVGVVIGCGTHLTAANAQDKPPAPTVPFSFAVVPGRQGITMAQNNPDAFYVVLTNISKKPQAVWEHGNSWAYKNISFEFTIPNGRKFVVSEAPQGFTVNYPSAFVIEPGEHQVYAIRLDKWWETHPSLPKADEMAIRLEAIYDVRPTPEAAKHKVWTGRVESKSYSFALRQW